MYNIKHIPYIIKINYTLPFVGGMHAYVRSHTYSARAIEFGDRRFLIKLNLKSLII